MSDQYIPFTNYLWVDQILPSFIGGLISYFLLGISLIQFKRVFDLLRKGGSNRTEISRTSKATWSILIGLLVFNLVDTVAKTHYLASFLRGCILQGLIFFSGKYPKSAFFYASGDAIIASTTHVAFIRRTLKLATSTRDSFRQNAPVVMGITYVLLGLTAVLSLTSFVAAVVESFIIISINFPQLKNIEVTLALWIGGSTAADIIVCMVFTFHLLYQRKASAFDRTVSLIDRWITLSLETGLAPAAVNIVHLTWFYSDINRGGHYSVSFWTPKVYVISVLTLYEVVLSDPAFQNFSDGSNPGPQQTARSNNAFPTSVNLNSTPNLTGAANYELNLTPMPVIFSKNADARDASEEHLKTDQKTDFMS